MQPNDQMRMDRPEEQLDALLGRLREEPVPPAALEASWRAIDARLEWRKPMSPLAFTRSVLQPKWIAAMSAAAVLLLAFVVGAAFAPGRMGARLAPSQDETVFTVARRGANQVPAAGMTEPGKLDDADLFETNGSMDKSSARGGEDAISDIPLGGKGTVGSVGVGGGGAAGAYGYREGGGRKSATARWGGTAAKAEAPAERGRAEYEESKKRDIFKNAKEADSSGRYPAAPAPSARPSAAADEKMLFMKSKEQLARQGGQLANPDLPAVTTGANKPLGAPGKDSSGQPPPAAPSAQKIIKTADLSLEVKKFETASREVDRLVTGYHGFYADNRVTQNEDGTTSAQIVIRVPQENFERLYAELKKLGRVKAENAKGEDVTEKYTDLSARIRNAERLEANLLTLLDEKKKGGKMSEILEVQTKLAETRETIEKYKGQMRVMENLIEFSTIYLALAERTRTVPTGSLSVEVKDASEADKALDAIMAALGGQVTSRTATKRPDGTSMVTAVLRAPMPRFGELVDRLKALGRVDREDVRGYNLAAITEDEGAKDVLATANLVVFEPSLQKPGGTARIEVETLEGAAKAIGDILTRTAGTQVSRQESREDGRANATYVLRVARAKFPELAGSLAIIGTVQEKQLVGADTVAVDGPAAKVPCDLTLIIYERGRQTPGASATVSATNLREADDKLNLLLKSIDGQIVSHTESRQPGGSSTAQYELRVKRGKFAALLAGLDGVGRVDTKQIQGLDLGEVKGAAADQFGSISLTVYERRAPVPGASLDLVVQSAESAGNKLQAVRDRTAAETVSTDTQQNADGSVMQVWRLRVAVEKFDSLIAEAQGLGRVRSKQIRGIRASAEEKPDPKAMADVVVTLTQISPTAPPDEQTTGTVRGMIRAALTSLYAVFGAILYGLIVVVPVGLLLAVIVVGIVKLIVRMARAGNSKPAGSAPEQPKRP